MSYELGRNKDGTHGSFRTSTPKHQNSVAIRAEVKRHNVAKAQLNKLRKLVENMSDQQLKANLMVSMNSLRGKGTALSFHFHSNTVLLSNRIETCGIIVCLLSNMCGTDTKDAMNVTVNTGISVIYIHLYISIIVEARNLQ